MFKKFFIFYLFFNLLNNCLAEKNFEIIATINNYSITKIDLKNEIKIIEILNKKKLLKSEIDIALNNLIDETLKNEELKKEKLEVNDVIIHEYYLKLIKNLNYKENEIDKKIISLIKKKIKIDKLWNDLIIQKYGWKININMNEIEQILQNKHKNQENLNKIKEQLILNEKNKKLSVFSKYHLNKLKEESLIKLSR